jgi:hypothetical protein
MSIRWIIFKWLESLPSISRIMKALTFLFTLCIGFEVCSQPATEVWLFDMSEDGTLSNPINVSSNPGYDNQPSFTHEGNKLLYASTRNGQTDIISYDLRTKEKTWLTSTPGSEYSPLQRPGTNEFSCILLEEGGRQLLWSYSLNGGKGEILIPYLKIGYHTWLNEDLLFAFVLGPHSTLQEIDLSDQKAAIIQEEVGRSLAALSNEWIIFIDQKNHTDSIKIYHPTHQSMQALINTLSESQDFAISNDGTLYMGHESKLYRTSTTPGKQWQEVFDLKEFGRTGITRLAISSDNDKIAIVVSE